MPTMDYEAAAARVLDYVKSPSHIHPENKRLIQAYHRDMVLADISSAQQQKVLSPFKIITDHVGQTPFTPTHKPLHFTIVTQTTLSLDATQTKTGAQTPYTIAPYTTH